MCAFAVRATVGSRLISRKSCARKAARLISRSTQRQPSLSDNVRVPHLRESCRRGAHPAVSMCTFFVYLRSTAPVQHASAQNWKFSSTSFGILGGQERTHLEILKKTCVYTVVHHVKYIESAHLLSVAARPIKKDEVCVQHGRQRQRPRASP